MYDKDHLTSPFLLLDACEAAEHISITMPGVFSAGCQCLEWCAKVNAVLSLIKKKSYNIRAKCSFMNTPAIISIANE